MITKDELLQKLPPFLNNRTVIMDNQNVNDIITGILETHEKYKADYDKISKYFLGKNIKETAYNVWKFLKENVPYRIESDNFQTLRSPSSIVSGLPADCKTMSLFSLGILQSLQRQGLIDCTLAYRFAGYNDFNNDLEHVFAVINPKSQNEIWCDAVLPNFNQKKQPTIYKDKNLKMSLVALSGIPSSLPLGPSPSAPQKPTGANILNTVKNLTSVVSSNGIPVVSTVASAIALLSNLVKSDHGTINDWQGWNAQMDKRGLPHGTPANYLAKYDGDAGVDVEAVNMIQWIANNSLEEVLGYNAWNKQTVTIDDVVNKITRGGYPKEAQALKNAYYGIATPQSGGQPQGGQMPAGSDTGATKTAGMNVFVTLALVGAAIFAITKMKKSA
jgi:hypothetical protein